MLRIQAATQFRVNLAVFQALAEAGLTIPFPQRDVHVKQATALT